MVNFGSGLVVGVRSVGFEFSMDFVLLVLSPFDRLGGDVECLLGTTYYEVSMLTASEGCVNGMFSGGVFPTGIIPGLFALVVCWCVRVAKRICVAAVGVDDFWVVCVGVAGTSSAVSPNVFAYFCNASPWRP